MNCSRCNSERHYQFEASASERPRPGKGELPVVCRDCGLVTIEGEAVTFPPELEAATRTLAEAQIEEVAKARANLESSTDDRVDHYMSKFFRTAYLEGFFRALAFFKHEARTGRLIRLRQLWSTAQVGWADRGVAVITMGRETYTEFEKLLHLSAAPGVTDAKSHSNEQAT